MVWSIILNPLHPLQLLPIILVILIFGQRSICSYGNGSVLSSARDPSKARKTRREKPYIALAPDQPPTTQGKPRTRVFVACLQCRTRKIRCDGAKPICHNCNRRVGNDECNYDAVPKRRGPDKTPGARQRLARDETADEAPPRRRRRTREEKPSLQQQSSASPDPSPSNQDGHIPIALPNQLYFLRQLLGARNFPTCEWTNYSSLFIQMPSVYVQSLDLFAVVPDSHPATTQSRRIVQVDGDDSEQQNLGKSSLGTQPSMDFTRKIWWDSLLSLYLSPNSKHHLVLTASQRDLAAQQVTLDLRFIFKVSNYWFAFFHAPTFFGNFFDPRRREDMQPSLILALLAISTFWKSSELEHGDPGRQRALHLREEAQSALEASVNAGWIDENLAQAAWVLSLFEVCAHPQHSTERCTSSLVMLDSIIRILHLTSVDAGDPRAMSFPRGAVPAVSSARIQRSVSWAHDSSTRVGVENNFSQEDRLSEEGCSCKSLTLGKHWPSATEHTPFWSPTPAWNDAWTEAEIKKESCRRLCWSSIIMAAGHISYTTACKTNVPELFIADPANYTLLFSGEVIAYSPLHNSLHSSRDTIWALHDRCVLLWNSCIRMRGGLHITNDNKTQFAVKTWLEADALEAALNRHTCGIERSFIYIAREYIFNTRMFISHEFRKSIPIPTVNFNGILHRDKAEEWLSHQASVAHRFMFGLHTITGNTGNMLSRRPFFVFWFMAQISRALSLWHCDNTLIVALDVCKAFLAPVDYLSGLWPCREQRRRYSLLREQLTNACRAAGISPPPQANFNTSKSLV
ncbi:hypothetical protein BDQ17DRAFT_1231610 [Cyathus striatus]|nr:hypothetical protein BDQ17DRAFT_1231610 [Cyathus striatus]